jgi:hypothetical protein
MVLQHPRYHFPKLLNFFNGILLMLSNMNGMMVKWSDLEKGLFRPKRLILFQALLNSK